MSISILTGNFQNVGFSKISLSVPTMERRELWELIFVEKKSISYFWTDLF